MGFATLYPTSRQRCYARYLRFPAPAASPATTPPPPASARTSRSRTGPSSASWDVLQPRRERSAAPSPAKVFHVHQQHPGRAVHQKRQAGPVDQADLTPIALEVALQLQKPGQVPLGCMAVLGPRLWLRPLLSAPVRATALSRGPARTPQKGGMSCVFRLATEAGGMSLTPASGSCGTSYWVT